MNPRGSTPPLAVVGFGQVCQLEVNCEGLGDAISIFNPKRGDQVTSLSHQPVIDSALHLTAGRLLTMLDQQTSQALDYIEKLLSFLLNENPPEQYAKQTDISAEGLFLKRVGGAGTEFG
jgi:hypothetical protein